MKTKLFTLLFCLFALFVSEVLASDPQPSPRVGMSEIESAFEKLKAGVSKFKLSNGLTVLMYKRDVAPVFTGEVWVRVGGVDEVPGKTGISHMLEHMAFKGTKEIGTKDYEKEEHLLDALDDVMEELDEHPSEEQKKAYKEVEDSLSDLWVDEEFSKLYEKRGAVGLNAGTSKDYTFYMVALPSSEFEFWCWMESERLLNPVFRQFYKEREVVKEERRMRTDDSPTGKLLEALNAAAYWNHPYGSPTIGWASDIASLRREDLTKLYATYYVPENMTLSIVGDIDPVDAKPLLEKYFGRISKSNHDIPKVEIKEPRQEGERVINVEFDSEPLVLIGFHKPIHPHEDDARFAVLHSILSSGRSSVLTKELVIDKKIATAVQTGEGPGDRFPSLFYVYGVPNKKISSDNLVNEIQQVLDRIKTTPFSSEEIEAAKRKMLVEFVAGLDSNYGLAQDLGNAETVYGNWEEIFKIYKTALETTPDDLMQLAKRYFNVSNRTTVKIVKKAAQ